MKSVTFNTEEYYSIKEIYTNLCVARAAIMKKLKRLEESGYVLRIKNKRPEIYISRKGYEILKEERIKYLNEQIAKPENEHMKEYYEELKEAIGKPELWDKYHNHILIGNLYFNNGELVAKEQRYNGESTFIINKKDYKE